MKRLAAVIALVAGAAALAGCAKGSSASAPATTTGPSTTTTVVATTTRPPEPLADQSAPPSINGLVVQGPTLWIASIKGDEILQVDRRSGQILRRIATEGAQPDDVAVAPDGSIWSTGFGNGDLGHIVAGRYRVEAHMAAGINPLEFGPNGTLYVGTYGPKGTLYAVAPGKDGQAATPVVVATDLPDINAFGVTPDGLIVAPAGGVTGPGSAIGITVPSAGPATVTTLATGLDPTAAGATDAQGIPYVLGSLSGKVYRIDPEAKTATVVRTVTTGAPFDNMAFAPDGTLYLSSFTIPSVTVVTPGGRVSQLSVGTPAR